MIKCRLNGRLLEHLLLSATLLAILAGCGWHLRGSLPLPAGLNSVFVINQAESTDLNSSLLELLKANDVTVANTLDETQLTITIVSQQNTRRIATLSSKSRVSEYELNSEAVFSIADAQGQMLLPATNIAVSRTYRYDENDVVGKAGEERLLQQEMLRELAQNILRRLRFLNLNNKA